MGSFHRASASLDHLERLGRGSSPVHRLSAFSKLLVTIIYIVLVISFPQQSVSALIPFVLYPAVMMSLSNTPWKPLCARLLVALPFALVIGLSNMFMLPDAAFQINGFMITRGMLSFASIILKTAFCVFAVLLLIATTPFLNIAALLTAAKPFQIIGLQIILTYRYISTLLEEAGALWTAYMLRAPGTRGVKMHDMGTFAGQLLLRSFDKAERVYYAMKCRGFTGVYYGAQSSAQALRRGDWIFMLGTTLTLMVMRAFNISLLLGSHF